MYNDIEVTEFTGLLDKNGKEVYEGDIIGNRYWCKSIVFYEGSFGYWDKVNSIPEFFMLYRYAKNQEVIGNIYENPELI
jgi:hypothetical protein